MQSILVPEVRPVVVWMTAVAVEYVVNVLALELVVVATVLSVVVLGRPVVVVEYEELVDDMNVLCDVTVEVVSQDDVVVFVVSTVESYEKVESSGKFATVLMLLIVSALVENVVDAVPVVTYGGDVPCSTSDDIVITWNEPPDTT